MLIVITGGAASGKSQFAEQLLGKCDGNKIYLATMHVDSHEETKYRIQRHQKLRAGKGFATVEKEHSIGEFAQELEQELGKAGQPVNILLECISNLLSNEMYYVKREYVVDGIVEDIELLCEKCACLIVITSEIGSDGKVYDDFTNEFIQNIARINQRLVQIADEAYEVVYSIPLRIK